MVEFRMPKLGESIAEATVISWLKNVGDFIAAEETLLEVATDKVDSEVPSPVSGIIKEIRFQKNDVVPVGTVMALIEASEGESQSQSSVSSLPADQGRSQSQVAEPSSPYASAAPSSVAQLRQGGATFLSPLIISIAQKENLSIEELQLIPGSGADGRLQKSDVYQYLKNRKYPVQSKPAVQSPPTYSYPKPKINFTEGKDYIIEMDRMRKMIADHMVYSKQTSPHVTSYLEVDVTDLVAWRNTNKEAFQAKTGQKLTFTPLFVEAVAKAIQAYPLINVAVEDTKIYVRKDINIGMATALPTGNLIVPVVRNADTKDLATLASDVNQLAESARTNTLKPEQIQGSTFTISNVGTFGSLMGTPIINQPEVAILAFGIIKKRPEVITTVKGDEIAIRSMMFLSLSFDHRVVDGFLGGSFLRKVGDYLEQFDTNTTY